MDADLAYALIETLFVDPCPPQPQTDDYRPVCLNRCCTREAAARR
jgi:hypothetical protein